jgi:hypothetical protein
VFQPRSSSNNDSGHLKSRPPLRAGDWVTVRSLPEILATLDSDGKLDSLPFMPEMIRFCGRKFVVAKRAEKTCVGGKQRRMSNAVHLADVRCDGNAHDGCQSACLLFWREDWLTRVSDPIDDGASLSSNHGATTDSSVEHKLHTRTVLEDRSVTYVCQATELQRASKGELNLWNLDQYYREIRAGNVGWVEIKHLLRWSLAWFQWRFSRHTITKPSTPAAEKQNIATGDLVEIRPKKDIRRTLTQDGKHRGLAFSAEMLTFTGKRYRVLDKVDRVIDEKTGRMKVLKNNCLILESVICRGHCTLCPRAEFLFWREEWLMRVQ